MENLRENSDEAKGATHAGTYATKVKNQEEMKVSSCMSGNPKLNDA